MVDFCVQRRGAALLPVSASDEYELLRLPERRVFSIAAAPKAPLKLQRWYRAGVQLLVEATGRWATPEIANREITIKAGFFESFVISTNGDVRFTPQDKSDWGLVEWRAFLDKALPVMMEFAGETRAQFRDRVDRYFGIKLREAWEAI